MGIQEDFMMKEYQDLINNYSEWLKQKIRIDSVNDTVEITTPFLDRHNDHIQLYVKKSNGRYVLTDDGYTITDLKLSGCDLSSEKRVKIKSSILNGFGVHIQDNELIVEANRENFSQRKHNLIQAILALNDLSVLAGTVIMSLFKEDVEAYLKVNEIRYTPAVSFTGKSGFVHSYDFVVPVSKQKPERILRAINSLDRQKAGSLIFSWNDTRDVRPKQSTVYGILNDTEQEVNPEHINALQQYGINIVLWSHRDEYLEELAV